MPSIPDFGPISLWRCNAPPAAVQEGLPPILVYWLGDDGPSLGRGLFEFIRYDEEVGDVVSLTSSASFLC